MKNMSKIMKEAHKLTREIKSEFPNVDYKTQLGICISYLLNEKEEKMVELKGSEKQVKWAESIRSELIKFLNENNNFKKTKAMISEKEEAEFFIDNFKTMTSKYANYNKKYDAVMKYEAHLNDIERDKNILDSL